MQKISTNLWYDTQAVEAAAFYETVFADTEEITRLQLHDTPSGDVDQVVLRIYDHECTMISAGPYFKFTPAVSFTIACETAEEVDTLWQGLSEDGTPMMELGSYPFSDRYGWIQDRYGVSWQIMLSTTAIAQKVTPTMMFVGDVCGKAEEAIDFYTGVFADSSTGTAMRYEAGEEPDKAGTLKYAAFTLEGQQFAAMDSARMHDFGFTEAISFVVKCADQTEIDRLWQQLSAVPESEQCGWLKDKYGFSWQIVPADMDTMIQQGSQAQIAAVTKAFLQMKKFDIATLQAAYDNATETPEK